MLASKPIPAQDLLFDGFAGLSTGSMAVAVPGPFYEPLDYACDLPLEPGQWVSVPLRQSETTGLVWGPSATTPDFPTGAKPRTLKKIIRVLDVPPAPAEYRRFLHWAASYTMGPIGAFLKPGAPPEKAEKPPKAKRGDAGLISQVPAALSPDQEGAAAVLRASVGQGFSSTLLDGVTGSGKTEVFLSAAEEAISRGMQVLILMPEIALTRQVANRMAERLGTVPHEWHSRLSPGERARTWLAATTGAASVIVGARSSLFLPFARLGLIVADEEHDGSFRQDSLGDRSDRVPHNARDLAVLRAKGADIPVVLASATPSLETWQNARNHRYRRVILPSRHGSAGLPTVEVIDLRQNPRLKNSLLSGPMVDAVKETIEAKGQALLFLNRRGWAAGLQCSDCGYRPACRHCSAHLVEHRKTAALRCHHCGHQQQVPEICEKCESPNLNRNGAGIEQLADETKRLFPNARILPISSDLIDQPSKAAELLTAFREHHYDIAVATQIISKGHNFPDLTLVGVVDADAWASADDPRANERNFQLLHQVGGRAGRASRAGRVLLQTYAPEAPVVKALISGDRDGFLEAEGLNRGKNGWAPFTAQAAVIVSGDSLEKTLAASHALALTAPADGTISIEGPIEPRLSMLRGRFRRRFLVTAPKGTRLQPILRDWFATTPSIPRGVTITPDIDPQDFS